MIEICGNLIVQLSKDEGTKTQQDTFFELLNERFLDVNPYCRCKALQVYHNKLLKYIVTYGYWLNANAQVALKPI